MANEIAGTDLFVFMGGVIIAHATDHTLNSKMTTRKTSNKDSGIFDTSAAGRLNITATCTGMIVYGDIESLRTAYITRNPLSLDFGEQVSGSLDDTKTYATGWFYLTGLDETAPDQGNATYSASFEHAYGFQYVSGDELTVRIAHSNCTTSSGTEGFVAALPVGGTPPYLYLWDDGGDATDQYVADLPAGTYTVIVTDSKQGTPNTATASVVVTEPPAA